MNDINMCEQCHEKHGCKTQHHINFYDTGVCEICGKIDDIVNCKIASELEKKYGKDGNLEPFTEPRINIIEGKSLHEIQKEVSRKAHDKKFIFNGYWIDNITINNKIIEIRNYGIVIPKGYKIGFVIDDVLVDTILTSSKEFEEIVGTNTFDDIDKLLNVYGNFMIKKHYNKIF